MWREEAALLWKPSSSVCLPAKGRTFSYISPVWCHHERDESALPPINEVGNEVHSGYGLGHSEISSMKTSATTFPTTTVRLMGLWFLLPNLSEDGCSIICLSPGTRNLPQSPWAFKDETQQLLGDMSQIPQQLPVRPVWSHGPSYSTGHWLHPPLLWLHPPSPNFDFWKRSLRPWSRLTVKPKVSWRSGFILPQSFFSSPFCYLT